MHHTHWHFNSNGIAAVDETVVHMGFTFVTSFLRPIAMKSHVVRPLSQVSNSELRGEMICLSYHTLTSIEYYCVFICMFFYDLD